MLGGHPFREMSSTRALRAVVEGRIPPTPHAVLEPLDSFARWLCARWPADRPQSAFDALRELQSIRLRLGGLGALRVPPAGKHGGWATLVGEIGQQLLHVREGQGGAAVVCGDTAEDRSALLDTVCNHAELMGIRVLRTTGSEELATALGCANDERSLFESLSDGAEERPTLVCVGDLPPGDNVLGRVVQLAARSGEPLLLLASASAPPAGVAGATVFKMK
jgi:hypothetical protein